MTEIVDKKFWCQGWWLRDFEEAKQKAEAIGSHKISWTPDKPRNLRLYAIQGNPGGRWYRNKIAFWFFRDR
jgi:hypothetical protein